jgi:DNA-directed RNA polymerase
MPTPAQIDEQVRFEREAVKCGIDKLYKNTQQLQEREYASATIFGVASIREAQAKVAEAILATFARVNEGKNGQHFADTKHYLAQFNNEEDCHILANIALKRTFDLVFSQKRKDSNKYPNAVGNVCVSIGHSVEAECQIRWYEEQDSELLKKIQKKYWLASTGTEQKLRVAQLMMNRHDYTWPKWSAPIRARLGGWLLDLVCNTTGWFERTQIILGKNNTPTLITPTEAYTDIQQHLMDEAVLFAPMAWPMLIEPNDWTNDAPGGYLLNEVMRGHDMVRHGDPSLRQPDLPIDFLNRLQKVAYRINPFIYDVAKHLDGKGYKLGKFKPLSHASLWKLPTPPADIETNEASRFQYRKDRTEAENKRKAYVRSLHVRTTATLEIASKFTNKDRFFLPWSFDYRGRAYPIPAFLTPHDTDFGKSLIRFADESFMTPEAEEWLAFQVATTYGLDKATMTERLEWAKSNVTLITAIATDPIGRLSDWENADEPWQFLAACDEYYHCVIAADRHFTGLMVAVDATCSGLQILAGLAKDKRTAQLVNVVPGDKPQDAYKTVAEAMMGSVPERFKPYFDRSCTKRSVMTIPYNATLQSSREYIRSALLDRVPKDTERPTAQEITDMAKALRAAMDVVAPGPLKVMEWIGVEMCNAIKRGNDVITWTTPSGFTVQQKRNKYDTVRLDLKLLGRCQFNIVSGDKGPDPRKHKSSGAPNLIHSIDASLLHLAFTEFSSPFSVIHDSVLCRATDMSILSTVVRQTYFHLFAEHDYLNDFATQIGAESTPPMIGDLEPETVIESTYFFC